MKNVSFERILTVGLSVISGLLGILITLMVFIWNDHNRRQDEQFKEQKTFAKELTGNVKENRVSIDLIYKYILIKDGVDLNELEWKDLFDNFKSKSRGGKMSAEQMPTLEEVKEYINKSKAAKAGQDYETKPADFNLESIDNPVTFIGVYSLINTMTNGPS